MLGVNHIGDLKIFDPIKSPAGRRGGSPRQGCPQGSTPGGRWGCWMWSDASHGQSGCAVCGIALCNAAAFSQGSSGKQGINHIAVSYHAMTESSILNRAEILIPLDKPPKLQANAEVIHSVPGEARAETQARHRVPRKS